MYVTHGFPLCYRQKPRKSKSKCPKFLIIPFRPFCQDAIKRKELPLISFTGILSAVFPFFLCLKPAGKETSVCFAIILFFAAKVRLIFYLAKFLRTNSIFTSRAEWIKVINFVNISNTFFLMSKKKRHNSPASPVDTLALSLRGLSPHETELVLRRAEGLRRMSTKVPSWAAVDDLSYPPRLSLEQCSSEATARYKAQVARRLVGGKTETMVDLTGGFGVDFSFIGALFKRPVYVERQEVLCQAARHNFPLLGLERAEVVESDGTDYLEEMQPASFIFLDPARRDNAGRKTVLIEDCEPNVTALLPLLLEKAPIVMVKLSPMLDIHSAVAALSAVRDGCVREVHAVADGGECKELLLVLGAEKHTKPSLHIFEQGETYSLDFTEEQTSIPHYADFPKEYLYEPGPAIMKAGAFKWTATHYDLEKLQANSHLYTGNCLLEHFPGRCFHVISVFSFSKADLKMLRTQAPQANISIRNFPGSVADLRKRLKIKEGGSLHIFATTLADNTHRLILTERLLNKTMHQHY